MPVFASEISSIQIEDNVLSITYQEDPDINRVIFGGEEGTGYVKVTGNSLDNIKANDQKLNLDSNSRIYFAAVGGFSKDEDVSGNKVTIDGATVGKEDGYGRAKIDEVYFYYGSVYGGLSVNGSVTKNKVEITDGTVRGDVYGGYSDNSSANDNEVEMNGGTVEGYVQGGYSYSNDATNNKITVTGGNLSSNYGFIDGAYSVSGNVKGNTVTITDITKAYTVKGGRSEYGNAEDNKVIISGGTVNLAVAGGYSAEGDATGNEVAVTGGKISLYNGYISGGQSLGRNVKGNKVTITDVTNVDTVYGGNSDYGNAEVNTVIIDGGTINKVFAGFGDAVVQGNEVIISNSTGKGSVGDVIGGSVSWNAEEDYSLVKDNVVTWKDGEIQGNVYGSVIKNRGVYNPIENTGGTFNVYHSSGSSSKTIAEGKSIA
ncbi:MAG: hypothetical protein HUJ56_08020, partial [Erysipelotrichaceae bacterium]|nr:hypothetical protein [Erysipelotrichaceae bacterium]